LDFNFPANLKTYIRRYFLANIIAFVVQNSKDDPAETEAVFSDIKHLRIIAIRSDNNVEELHRGEKFSADNFKKKIKNNGKASL